MWLFIFGKFKLVNNVQINCCVTLLTRSKVGRFIPMTRKSRFPSHYRQKLDNKLQAAEPSNGDMEASNVNTNTKLHTTILLSNKLLLDNITIN